MPQQLCHSRTWRPHVLYCKPFIHERSIQTPVCARLLAIRSLSFWCIRTRDGDEYLDGEVEHGGGGHAPDGRAHGQQVLGAENVGVPAALEVLSQRHGAKELGGPVRLVEDLQKRHATTHKHKLSAAKQTSGANHVGVRGPHARYNEFCDTTISIQNRPMHQRSYQTLKPWFRML